LTTPHHCPTLFPYTTLFRSLPFAHGSVQGSGQESRAVGTEDYGRNFLGVPEQSGPHRVGVRVAHENILRSRTRRGEQSSIGAETDRKSTRLNSSHVAISYAV